MYGYSWIKPAGCSKTMLGRREEEVEREEMERQLREVEMQERMQAEADEMDRQVERDAEGDAAGMDQVDLDDEVPDADNDLNDGWDDEDEVSELGEPTHNLLDDDEMAGNLDDDIPSASEQDDMLSPTSSAPAQPSSPQHNTWTYDSRRAPSSPPSSPHNNAQSAADAALHRIRRAADLQRQRGQFQRRPGAPGSDYDVDERDTEALALADDMLDEDELAEGSFHQDRDLDDSIPDADDPNSSAQGEWEHTDSDLSDNEEDEEMDISLLPAAHPATRPSRLGEGPQTQRSSLTHGGARVLSGNAAHPPPQPHISTRSHREGSAVSSVASSSAFSSGRRTGLRSQHQHHPHPQLPSQPSQPSREGSYDTPSTAQRPNYRAAGRGIPRTSTLLSTSAHAPSTTEAPFSADVDVADGAQPIQSQAQTQAQGIGQGQGQAQPGRRNWLNPASARRNLFGLRSGTGSASAGSSVTGDAGASSGGLFTPDGPSFAPSAVGAGATGGVGYRLGFGGGGAATGGFETPETPLDGSMGATGGEEGEAGTPAQRTRAARGRLLRGLRGRRAE